ncbi:glycosyltransferase family 4 protein [candidate division CSSED10-310 bacterium]|uniref:Glycosyltransferase family 4 protein n=1 Tax=candidate division CSSED10-310 bacterium TaxID=2855610 RepID=A0ABV6YWF2_UNCC1
MRILFVIHDFLPRHRAGSELYTYYLAQELAQQHTVAIFYVEFDPTSPNNKLNRKKYLDLVCFEYLRRSYPDEFEKFFLSSQMRLVFENVLHVFQPDVVHFQHLLNHSFDYPELLKTRGIPSLFTLHDYFLSCASWKGGQRIDQDGRICHEVDFQHCMSCLTLSRNDVLVPSALPRSIRLAARIYHIVSFLVPEKVRQSLSVWVRKFATPGEHGGSEITLSDMKRRHEMVQSIYRNVDLFIAPSRFLQNIFIAHGIPEDKIIYTDYGFDLSRFSPPKTVGTSWHQIRIGFIGTPVFHKGVHILVEAYEKAALKDCCLTIYGDTGIFPIYSASLKEMSQDSTVIYAGPFENSKIARILSTVDVLVVPSLWFENSPLTIHEAFQAGVPVITSDLGGMAELVQEGINGLLFRVGDVNDLADKIRLFARDADFRQKLARGARNTKVKSIQENAREMEELYESLLRKE